MLPRSVRLTRRAALAGLSVALSACGGDDHGVGAAGTAPDASASAADSASLGDAYRGERADAPRLDPGRVRQVAIETSTGHRLFRGNAPIAGGSFEIEPLRAALAAAALASPTPSPLPARYRIVDVSLLNDLTESDALEIERRFWAEHPDDGSFVQHPIYGSLIDPGDLPTALRRTLERGPGLDRMDTLLERLRKLLRTPAADGIPSMVFVHCMAGRDRTGEVVASWRLRFEGVSYRAAVAEAQQVAGRAIVRYSRYGLKWYAFDLQDHGGVATIGPISDA